MKFFNFGKKDEVVDLPDYTKQQNWPLKDENNSEDLVLDSEQVENPHEKKKKFVKRIMDLTDKIEELTNQIYHLQQRVELLERKLNIYRE